MSDPITRASEREKMLSSDQWIPCECSSTSIDAEWDTRGHRAFSFRLSKTKSSQQLLQHLPKFRRPPQSRYVHRLAYKQFLHDSNAPDMLFERLADKWDQETAQISSPIQKAQHAAYKQIISMGEEAIPLVLRRMRDHGGHWFWALSLLAKVDPVPQDSRGRISEMRSAWIQWGYERGYI